MAASNEQIVLNVIVNGKEQFDQLSSSLRTVVIAADGLQRKAKGLDTQIKDFGKVTSMASVHQRALAQAVGVTTKGLNEHAKSIKQTVANQRVLNSEIKSLTKDAANLRASLSSINDATKKSQITRYASQVDSLASAMRRIKSKALVSDLRSVSLAIKKMGKDAQFVGRSLIIGLTMPLLGFANRGIDALKKLDMEVVRLNKILNATPQELNSISDSIYEMSAAFGVSRDLVTAITADFAELGINGTDSLMALTKATNELAVLGSMDIAESQDLVQTMYLGTIRTINKIPERFAEITSEAEKQALAINSLTGQLYIFNAVENNTALSMRDMASALPEVTAAANVFGLSMTQSAALLAPMKAAGIDVKVAANGIKVSLQRMVTPTGIFSQEVANLTSQFAHLAPHFEKTVGVGMSAIQGLTDATAGLQKVSSDETILRFYAKLFGKRQSSRMLIAIDDMVAFQNQFFNIETASRDLAPVRDRLNGIINTVNKANNTNISFMSNMESMANVTAIASAKAGQSLDGIGVVTQDMITSAQQMRAEFRNFVKDYESRTGVSIVDQISSQAGKTLFIEMLGAANAQEIAQQELNVALESTSKYLDRMKIALKNVATEFLLSAEPAFRAASIAIQKFATFVRDLPDSIKIAIIAFAGLAAAIGPLVFVTGQLQLAFGVVSGLFLKMIPGVAALTPELLAANKGMLYLNKQVVNLGGGLTSSAGPFERFIARMSSGSGPVAKFARQFGEARGILNKEITAAADVQAMIQDTSAGSAAAVKRILDETFAQNMIVMQNGATTSGSTLITAGTSVRDLMIQGAIQASAILNTGNPMPTRGPGTQGPNVGPRPVSGARFERRTIEGPFKSEVYYPGGVIPGTNKPRFSRDVAKQRLVVDEDKIRRQVLSEFRSQNMSQRKTVLSDLKAQGFITEDAKGRQRVKGKFVKKNDYTSIIERLQGDAAADRAIANSKRKYLNALNTRAGQIRQDAQVALSNPALRDQAVKSTPLPRGKAGTASYRIADPTTITPLADRTSSRRSSSIKKPVPAVPPAPVPPAAPRLGKTKKVVKGLLKPITIPYNLVVKQNFDVVTSGLKKFKGLLSKIKGDKSIFKLLLSPLTKGFSLIKNVIGVFGKFTKMLFNLKFILGGGAMLAVIAIFVVLGKYIKMLIDKFDVFKKAAAPGFEALRAALDAVKAALSAIVAPFRAFFSGSETESEKADTVRKIANAFNVVAKWIQVAAEKFQEFSEKYIAPFVGKILSSIRTLSDGFIGVIKGIIQMVRGVKGGGEVMSDGFKKVWMGIAQFLYGTILPLLIDITAAIIKGIITVMSKLIIYTPKILGEVIQAFVEMGISLAGLFVDLLAGIIDMALSWGESFVDIVLKAVNKLIGGFNSVLRFLNLGEIGTITWSPDFSGVANAVRGVADDTIKLLNGLGDEVEEGNWFARAGDWITDKINGPLTAITDGLNSGVDALKDGLKGLLERFVPESIAGTDKTAVRDAATELFDVIVPEAENGGEEAGSAFVDKFAEALKELQQKFIDLMKGVFKDRLDEAIEGFIDALEKQRDSALDVFDQQLEALATLEKAEESLMRQREYIANRKRMLDERMLNHENYMRNRALAIYEGRIDDARMLDLEEKANAMESAASLQDLDNKRNEELRKENLEYLRDQIKKAKEEADAFFQEQIEAFKRASEEITKFAPNTIEDYEEQLNALKEKAIEFSDNNAAAFAETFLKMGQEISANMPNQVVGVFGDQLDEIIQVARDKYGLDTNTGVFGSTLDLLTMMGDAFDPSGVTGGIVVGEWKDLITEMADEIKSDAADGIKAVIENHGPQVVLADAIKFANDTILHEWKGTLGHIASEVDGMAGFLDPMIREILKAQTALEALMAAASGAGAGSNGGTSPSPSPTPTPQIPLEKTGYITQQGAASLRISLENWLKTNYTGSYAILMNKLASPITNFTALMNTNTNTDLRRQIYQRIAGTIASSFDKSVFKRWVDIKYPGVSAPIGYESGYLMANGGFVTPGFDNTPIRATLHGGEYVVNAKAVKNIGLATLQSLNNMRFKTPTSYSGGTGTVNNTTNTTNIYVENFIGEDEWFQSMLKEYNMKQRPLAEKRAGNESRFYSTYKSGAGY